MKVAVLGTGGRGSKHVEAWQKAGHEVVSVTDIDLNRAGEIARQYSIGQIFADYKEALSAPEVDIASVSLPLAFHAPATIFAARQGKHIFCEKPLAGNMDDALAMEEAVIAAGVQFCLGFQRNLSRGLHQVKEWVQSGKFGRPLLFSSELLQEIRPKRTMHDAKGNMGPIVDACCHDFLGWQTIYQSRAKTVYARGGILAKDAPDLAHIAELAIDTATIIVEFESGDVAEMTVSWGLPPGTRLKGRPDRIFGPLGGAEGKVGSNRLMLLEGNQSQEIVLQNPPDLLAELVGLFATAIQQGGPAPTGFAEGKDMIRLSLAILESIRTGEVVRL
jgi:predicted dehydrogenase